MKRIYSVILGSMLAFTLIFGSNAFGAVSEEEASTLKTTLTPLGAERAGNADGSIPAWDGGLTKQAPGFKNGGKRPDLFPEEQPLFSITSENMAQYADKLTDGSKTMLKKYSGKFRIDVYPTHRTHAAPDWVYENTYKNALNGKLDGDEAVNVYGGIPFPIPKSGIEVMWNHLLRWRATSFYFDFTGWVTTSTGKHTLLIEAQNEYLYPYYLPDGTVDSYSGEYQLVRSTNSGPPIRAGEAISGRLKQGLHGSKVWVYIPGQRRVRKVPVACCDTPTPFSAGLSSYDEVDVFTQSLSLERFDWKIVEKKEMLIPYNTNKHMEPDKPEDILYDHYLNPDYVRWELHRVWVVEATLREGQRHTSPRNLYYVDEDSWIAVLGDRWDANDQLWRSLITLPIAAPDIPGAISTAWGYYDLIGGTYFMNAIFTGKDLQYEIMPDDYYPDRNFTPAAMRGEGVR